GVINSAVWPHAGQGKHGARGFCVSDEGRLQSWLERRPKAKRRSGVQRMHGEELNQRLSGISTVWTLLRQAHEGTAEAAAFAKEALSQRYRKAVSASLRSALGDPAIAEELPQEFAVSLVRGDFRNVDPQRGRFRYYLKTVLSHLVSNYRRKGRRLATPLA